MQLNWGTGIALIYTTFAVSMIGLAIASGKQDPGLVSKNYYDLDLNYQQRLEEKQNTAALNKSLEIKVLRGLLMLKFPVEIGLPTGGTVKMYRGNAADQLISATIKTDSTGLLKIPLASGFTGRWHIEVVWQRDSKSYFYESIVFLKD